MSDDDDPSEYEDDEYPAMENALAARDDEALSSLKMTPKIAPAFDGSMPFYMYEEIVEEWTSLTTLEPRLWATNLRNRLTGEAMFANYPMGIPTTPKNMYAIHAHRRPQHLANKAIRPCLCLLSVFMSAVLVEKVPLCWWQFFVYLSGSEFTLPLH